MTIELLSDNDGLEEVANDYNGIDDIEDSRHSIENSHFNLFSISGGGGNGAAAVGDGGYSSVGDISSAMNKRESKIFNNNEKVCIPMKETFDCDDIADINDCSCIFRVIEKEKKKYRSTSINLSAASNNNSFRSLNTSPRASLAGSLSKSSASVSSTSILNCSTHYNSLTHSSNYCQQCSQSVSEVVIGDQQTYTKQLMLPIEVIHQTDVDDVDIEDDNSVDDNKLNCVMNHVQQTPQISIVSKGVLDKQSLNFSDMEENLEKTFFHNNSQQDSTLDTGKEKEEEEEEEREDEMFDNHNNYDKIEQINTKQKHFSSNSNHFSNFCNETIQTLDTASNNDKQPSALSLTSRMSPQLRMTYFLKKLFQFFRKGRSKRKTKLKGKITNISSSLAWGKQFIMKPQTNQYNQRFCLLTGRTNKLSGSYRYFLKHKQPLNETNGWRMNSHLMMPTAGDVRYGQGRNSFPAWYYTSSKSSNPLLVSNSKLTRGQQLIEMFIRQHRYITAILARQKFGVSKMFQQLDARKPRPNYQFLNKLLYQGAVRNRMSGYRYNLIRPILNDLEIKKKPITMDRGSRLKPNDSIDFQLNKLHLFHSKPRLKHCNRNACYECTALCTKLDSSEEFESIPLDDSTRRQLSNKKNNYWPVEHAHSSFNNRYNEYPKGCDDCNVRRRSRKDFIIDDNCTECLITQIDHKANRGYGKQRQPRKQQVHIPAQENDDLCSMICDCVLGSINCCEAGRQTEIPFSSLSAHNKINVNHNRQDVQNLRIISERNDKMFQRMQQAKRKGHHIPPSHVLYLTPSSSYPHNHLSSSAFNAATFYRSSESRRRDQPNVSYTKCDGLFDCYGHNNELALLSEGVERTRCYCFNCTGKYGAYMMANI